MGETISNTTSNTIITSTSDADSIYNDGKSSVTIDVGAGDDTVYNYSSRAHDVTIIAGDGNDSVNNDAAGVLIEGGDGNDTITNGGTAVGSFTRYGNVTINGGKGNDVITHAEYGPMAFGGQAEIVYKSGDGHDTIYNYAASSLGGSTDTLNITGSSISTTTIGSDIIINIDNGSITLKDYAGVGEVNMVTVPFGDDTVSSVSGGDDTTSSIINDDTTPSTANDDTTSHVNDDDTTSSIADDDTMSSVTPDDTSPAVNNDSVASDGIDALIDLSIVRSGKTGSFFVTSSDTLDDNTYHNALFQADGSVNIPADAVTYNDHSYYVFNDVNTDWYTAEDFAESVGGSLVIITSEGEQNVVQGMLESLDESVAKNNYWMGATIDSDNVYRWVDGTPVDENSYTHWQQSNWKQPDGDSGAIMMYYGENPYTRNLRGDWNDFPTSGVNGESFFGVNNFGAIVEWNNEPSTVVGTVSSDHVYAAASDAGRQFITVADDWNVTATKLNDFINVEGNDVSITGGTGADSINVGSAVSTITFADYETVDVLSFKQSIAEHSLTSLASADSGDLTLQSDQITLIFENKTLSAIRNDTVDNAGTSNTIEDLLATVDSAVPMPDSESRVQLHNWRYGFDPSGVVTGGVSSNNVIYLLGSVGGTSTPISADGNSEVSIWLNDETYADVAEIDASRYNGQATLVGNALDNIIRASNGNSSLWGGDSGDDTLFGSDGVDEFFYLKGNGNDVIENAGDNDLINLLNVSLTDIDLDSFPDAIGADSTTIKFNDGGSIKVNGTSEVGFKLVDVDCTFYVKDHQWNVK